MVQAPVRLCAAAVRRTADRTCRAARRRSGADRGIPGQDLRYLPGHRSPREDRKAGPHRQYRRKEPGKIRPVAVAADARRRPRHQPDQARGGRDRLSTSCSPSPTGSILRPPPIRSATSTTRPATKLRALPSNDDVLADAMRQSRVVLGETGLPYVVAELDKELPVTGLAMLGEDPQRFMLEVSGAAAQHAGAGSRGRRARPAYDLDRARRHRAAGAGDHAGAGRDHAVAEFRDAAGGHRLRYDLDQIQRGRHRQRRGQGSCGPDRPQRSALGAFCALRSIDLCLGGRCARRKSRPGHHRGQAGADRDVGRRPARRQDHADFAGDARRRNPRPGAGSRADRAVAVAAGLGAARRISFGHDARHRGHLVCSEVRGRNRSSPSARSSRRCWSERPGTTIRNTGF